MGTKIQNLGTHGPNPGTKGTKPRDPWTKPRDPGTKRRNTVTKPRSTGTKSRCPGTKPKTKLWDLETWDKTKTKGANLGTQRPILGTTKEPYLFLDRQVFNYLLQVSGVV